MAICRQCEQLAISLFHTFLQTVEHLHVVANMCHLDISGSNVMLRTDDFEAWDQLRLIDFGFSQFCEPGTHCTA